VRRHTQDYIVNFYRWLLHLYPWSFQAEYAREMTAIFSMEWKRQSGVARKTWFLLTAIMETVTNAWLLHWEIARRDLRHSSRSLLRSPGFAVTAILLVTIGIGANLAVFTLANFVLVKPLPFPDPSHLLRVWEVHPGYSRMELSPANYRDVVAINQSFREIAAYNFEPFNLVSQGEPAKVDGSAVTANLFSVLEKPPLLGRTFREEDGKAGAPARVVLSYALWQAAFGGDRDIVGKPVSLNGESYSVIGVMPADFLFPERETQLWTAFRFTEEDYRDRDDNYLVGIGRLKPGISPAQARGELALIAARLRTQYRKENESVDLIAVPLRDEIASMSRFLLYGLCGAALCVLTIACANLANLLLARSLARQRELAIRLSLGAGRRTLVRQLLTESLLLGVVGGACAIGVAVAALPLLSRLIPNALPVEKVPSIDPSMLGFALGLTFLTILGFSTAPALAACRGDRASGLRVGGRGATMGRQRARTVMVVVEVAASVVLLVCSGLLMRALWRVQSVDPGFYTRGVLSLRTQLPFPKYNNTRLRQQFYDQVLTNVRRLPGVIGAGYVTALPMTWGGGVWPVEVNGSEVTRAASTSASLRFVTPGLFSSLGIPLKVGRDVQQSDTADRPWVAVVSESFVQRYWPNEQPIGRHFKFALHDHEVVGVVGDIRARGLERTSEPQVYLSSQQDEDNGLTYYAPKDLVIHSSGPATNLLPEIRQIMHAADPEQPISDVRTIEEVLGGETESRAVQMRVLIVFTGVAIFLAGLGIYGLLAFTVSMREQEFGIRLALGADKGNILGMVVKQGAQLAFTGLLFGVLFAYLAARVMQSLLAGVKPADAPAFSIAAGVCLLTSLLGCVAPALRAIRTDPTTVMRTE
jgi:predicted permease